MQKFLHRAVLDLDLDLGQPEDSSSSRLLRTPWSCLSSFHLFHLGALRPAEAFVFPH